MNSRQSTTKNMKVYHDPRWRAVRRAALRRDDWKCVNCGANVFAKGLARVDHIKLVEVRPDLAFDVDNLRTLCVKCDASRHWLDRGGKNLPTREGGYVGVNAETGEKLEIGEDGWPVSE